LELNKLITEKRNLASWNIDQLSTVEMLKIINQEDHKVPQDIEQGIAKIAEAVDAAALRFKNGGRLIYLGAGTSGRLGILDAAELVPTFNVPAERAIGIIAGGNSAIQKAVEGAEDSVEGAIKDLSAIKLSSADILIAISASGRTPYAISGLNYGNEVGALTISVTNNQPSEMSKVSSIAIDVPVGAEVVTGSTRMKAGSAQKMILNMISTGIMIKVGKVYQNLMINVLATNEKLVERGIQIISEATKVDRKTAEKFFEDSGHQVSTAILMIELKIDRLEAEKLLKMKDGNISHIIHERADE
jgi:N-acetylmuramic acid 6-phosphate etherase